MSTTPRFGRLAIIPARAGSKRLPGKNMLSLQGKPLIAWTVEAARAAAVFDRIIVSTDSPELARVARDHGAETPFLRPDELASDTASSADVVLHALKSLGDYQPEHFCLLQPTSPLRRAEHVRAAWQLLLDRQAANVVSVCECEHSPLWTNQLPPSGSLGGFMRPEHRGLRSQDLPAFYRINGAIYWLQTESFLTQRAFLLEQDSYAYVMSRDDSIDIDTRLDFDFCSFLLTRNQP